VRQRSVLLVLQHCSNGSAPVCLQQLCSREHGCGTVLKHAGLLQLLHKAAAAV
jgi:hypothetical protein